MKRRFSWIFIFLTFCHLALTQNIDKPWRHQLQLGASFANGRILFPNRNVPLGNDLSIRLGNDNRARQHLFEIVTSFRYRRVPLEPYVSFGYWYFDRLVGYTNFRWREDRDQLFPGTFFTTGEGVKQHRLATNVGTMLHLTNWLYIRGGLSLVATLSSADWEGGLSTRAAMDLYRPAFELHKYWQPTHWYGSYGAGVQGWGFFAEYYQQHSLNSFVSHIPFRGVTHRADFGRNSNYGIAVGYRASLAQWQGLFSNKPTSRVRMATLF